MEIGLLPEPNFQYGNKAPHANGNVSMAIFHKPSYLNVYKPPGASLARSFSVKVFLSFSHINNNNTIVFKLGNLPLIGFGLIRQFRAKKVLKKFKKFLFPY